METNKKLEFSEEDMIEFLKFVENNYYFNSGCWVNCETDKVTHRKELLQLWKEQRPKITNNAILITKILE